jgi:hypothetical protein
MELSRYKNVNSDVILMFKSNSKGPEKKAPSIFGAWRCTGCFSPTQKLGYGSETVGIKVN